MSLKREEKDKIKDFLLKTIHYLSQKKILMIN